MNFTFSDNIEAFIYYMDRFVSTHLNVLLNDLYLVNEGGKLIIPLNLRDQAKKICIGMFNRIKIQSLTLT